jgi:hypothetical protein
MTRIIPGVEVQVVKEVLPQQLSPSGVLGLVGFVENPADPKASLPKVVRASSFARFIEVLRPASAYSLPEARQALDNGAYQLVVAPLGGGKPATVNLPTLTEEAAKAAAAARTKGDDAGAKAAEPVATTKAAPIKITARANGTWANDVKVTIAYRNNVDGTTCFDVRIARPAGGEELFRDVRPETFTNRIGDSKVVIASAAAAVWPTPGDYVLAKGADATPEDYTDALDRLREEPDVDMVLAAVQDFEDLPRLAKIYGAVISHVNRLSGDCKGRLGFGQAPDKPAEAIVQLAQGLASDRFVLVAPHGAAAPVAGLVGSLPYFQSPTFKGVSGLADLDPISTDDQATLLTGGVVPVVLERGRGVILLRGITTDGDQISVRRVADRAVRMMKMVGDRFIGLLNNADGRAALKQRLAAELLQMEKEGAIVPSTDGKDPAFSVDVYASQEDFAKGILRVSMAVRPVRAIDYIYATITVQV